ncbi:MAG: radical SAM family heme chaperone HemW [Endomicrobia bacterium]|nr:radical SAM family heme chaperone HemW [Endomicrobiia bacterium]MDW8055415.1 radical SAM family heme chaperone HemW [Elusimicrobiota bacterium]
MTETGLYVHIPFCKSKCYYCDFYSLKYKKELADEYLAAMEKEIIELENKYGILNSQVCTLYIGGGSPSTLSEKQFENLFNLLLHYFNLQSLKEISVEVNPESITETKISIVKSMMEQFPNVKLRISVGVQSFNEKILKNLGRIHTKDDIYNTVDILTRSGIRNYNFDLIFGCPGQTTRDLLSDIEQALLLKPTHISYYALTVEHNTKLAKMNFVPDDNLQAEMYNKIVNILTFNGYNQYEISNFALQGYECLHNLNYWFHGNYIGLGPSSVSFFCPLRIKNTTSLTEYLKAKFRYSREYLDSKKILSEKIILALRTSYGIDTNILKRKSNSRILKKMLSQRLLIKQNNKLRIAPKYLFLSNFIIKDLI